MTAGTLFEPCQHFVWFDKITVLENLLVRIDVDRVLWFINFSEWRARPEMRS